MTNCKPGLILLAGGLGSRSKNPETPKILQEIAPGVTLLDLHLKHEHLFSEIHFLLGFGFDKIVNWIEFHYAHLKTKIFLHVEESKLGTAGAIKQVDWNHFKADRYHVTLGDILTNCNYEKLDSLWVESKALGYVAVHPNLHPKDSDRVLLSDSGTVIKLISKGTQESSPNRAVAGVFGFYKNCFSEIPDGDTDISLDFLPVLIKDLKLIGINSRDYFRDVGTPERLARGQSDYRNGSFTRRSRRCTKALFIDRDGTIIPDIPRGRSKIIDSEIDSQLLRCIITCNELGVPVFMVTNQPAIAKGWLSENEVKFVHQEMEIILSSWGAFIDEISFCPHHPEKGFLDEIIELKVACTCRKPEIGQYEKIAQYFDINLEGSLFVGDSLTDEMAAKRLNARFLKWEIGYNSNPIDLLKAEIEKL